MKLAIVFAATILAVSALSEKDHWNNFKVNYNKVYRNQVEESHRFDIFRNNLKSIEEHNAKYEAGEVGYYKVINEYADTTAIEFSAKLGLKKTNRTLEAENYAFQGLKVQELFDWREKGAVLAVRNQADCGSCWAFSATGALEGQNYIKNKKSVLLSPQELVDCSTDYGNGDCEKGGNMLNAFAYVKDHGLDAEADYPYEADQGQCRAKSTKAISVTGYKVVDKNEDVIKEALATIGPLSIAINAEPLHFYGGGVIDTDCDPDKINHGVLLVGYGSILGIDYWIVKNSWGEDWGENGYFKLKRGINQCGLTTEVCYPIL